MRSTASAPAKVILLGEHFVVYGEPALVIALERRVYVTTTLRSDNKVYIDASDIGAAGYFWGRSLSNFTVSKGEGNSQMKLEPLKVVIQKALQLYGKSKGIDVTVKSEIPVAAGLGSSAAVAVATAAALNNLLGLNLTKEKIFQLAYESERVIHGTPSGIDPAISTYGGVVLYRRNEGVRPLQVKTDIPIVVGETGFERSTGDMVAKVRKLRDTYPSLIDPIIRIGGLIVKEALHALEEGDLKVLGDLMNIDHGLLSAVGVSSCTIEKLVYMARQAGALGAKLTGAGGGGCIIALTEKDNIWKVKKAMQNAGWKAFAASRAREGVRIESNYT